jgi:hypothetical protein
MIERVSRWSDAPLSQRIETHSAVPSGNCGGRRRPTSVLRDLEKEARDVKRGLWSDPKPVEPWEWRKAAAAARKL